MVDRIGVVDSGVGGLTVVKQLQEKFQNSDIVFIGDSANCPYGNKSYSELISLGNNLIGICKRLCCNKVILGCNTLSSIVDSLDNSIPVIDIITPTIDYINKNNIVNIGVLGTEATIASGKYHIPKSVNISIGDTQLAKYIDNYDLDAANKLINLEIDLCRRVNCSTILLGCTHYPIVVSENKDLVFLNPACLLVDTLEINSSVNSVKLFTTGDLDIYRKICNHLHIKNVQYAKLSDKIIS